MKPLSEWQGWNEAVAVSCNTSTFHVLDTCPDLCIATQQPFRELILPMSLPSPKNNSPRSVPKHFTKPVHSTAPGRGAAHLGWARLPKVVLLKSLWHANIAQTSCGSLDILPFCAFASQAYICPAHNLLHTPTFQTMMVQFLGWGQGFKCLHRTSLLMDEMNHGTDLFCLSTDKSPQSRYLAQWQLFI